MDVTHAVARSFRVLAWLADRIGRRKGLIVTLRIMAMGTVLIAFAPGYALIGIAAPILVLLGRSLQGFSAGVELGGVSVYLSGMATPGHKGFFVSWQSTSQQMAVKVVALLGFTLNKLLEPTDIATWGWRVPFVLGCLIVPFIFYACCSKRQKNSPRVSAIRQQAKSFALLPPTGASFSAVWRWSSRR